LIVSRFADQNENPGSDNGPDTETGQAHRPKNPFQPVITFCFMEQSAQGFFLPNLVFEFHRAASSLLLIDRGIRNIC
jgi:hypothetical protein